MNVHVQPHNRQMPLRLIAGSGTGRRDVVNVPASGVLEAPLAVSFEGLTDAEQRRALAGFPGGRRFTLVRDVRAAG